MPTGSKQGGTWGTFSMSEKTTAEKCQLGERIKKTRIPEVKAHAVS